MRWALLMLAFCFAAGNPSAAQNKGIDPVLLAKAKAGDAEAAFHVAVRYAQLGNTKESDRWHLIAAQHGYVVSMDIVASNYERGSLNTPMDSTQAAFWYSKAAEAGSSSAMLNLGDMYRFGQGIQQDFTQAEAWFLKAAQRRYDPIAPVAEYSLGRLYMDDLNDTPKAIEWFTRAAQHGNDMAQLNLGAMYARGDHIQQDDVQAAIWWRKAAEQDNVAAQAALASSYQLGSGVPKDYTQAAMWYRKAADNGRPDAQSILGRLYEDGRGVPQDYQQAALWYRRAADQGDASAQNDLGLLYENGKGVSQDFVEAYFWLCLAASKSPELSANRDRVASKLTKAALLQDQERARKWFEDHPAMTTPQ